ncbi:MAG TPA: phosphoglycolate phosphatase [Ruminococcaceae bacterium]|nr:phosphoglycolate phosphatase [Oscillospiraceae bacterium]
MKTDLKNIKNIFFDLDGTITNSKVGITKSAAYALRSFGISVTDLDDLLPFIGPPLKESFMRYYDFTEQDAILAVRKYGEYFSKIGLYENAVYSGIESMLHQLRLKKRTLFVATSKPTYFAIKILSHFHLLSYFHSVFGSELDGTRSQKDEVLLYGLEQRHITDLSTTIMIGDRLYDIYGAKKAGISSIGVLYGFGSRFELEDAGADYIIETVSALSALLTGTKLV